VNMLGAVILLPALAAWLVKVKVKGSDPISQQKVPDL
jgi:hypothetical protein